MTVCFVTGTDTGVGKTVVTAALAAILSARGRKVAVVKPAQTGLRPGEAGDVDEVRRLAGPVDVAEGARLPDPLAPDRAALVAGVELPRLHDQLGLILGAAAGRDDVLVEGAGGVTVNLGRTFGLLDLAGQVRQAGQPRGVDRRGPRRPRHPQPHQAHRRGHPGPRVRRAGHRHRLLARRTRSGRAA